MGHKFTFKKSFFKVILQFLNQYLGIFAAMRPSFFLYLKNKVMGSEVCLERCDSYGNFGYLEKNQTFYSRRIL